MGRTPLEDTTTKVIFETKMLATMILSTSMMAALVAGSALPHPEMPPLQERGECMAWSWSSATGWKCTQELNTDPVDLDKFRQDSLAAHNAYRAKHGVAALKISAELNALAQEWAEHLIATGTFEHRPNNKNGENIYMSTRERLHKSRRRELSTVGTLRSRIIPLEKNRAWVDPLLATSPRLCGKEALRLELASHRKEARWLWWQTILPLATMVASMLTMFLHPSRGATFNTSVDIRWNWRKLECFQDFS